MARKCSGTGGRCSEQKHAHPKASASRSEICSSRDHTRPHRLSFALAMILTVNARRFQRTDPLSETGSALNTSKDIGMGVTDFALTCGSEPVVDAVCTAVVGSARTGRVLDAASDREDRSSEVCYAGDTRDSYSHSLKKMMTACCTLIISAEQHEWLLATDIMSHRNNALYSCWCVTGFLGPRSTMCAFH